MAESKPRIIVFSLAYLPFTGGTEFAIKEVTDRLGDKFDFDLICYCFDSSWLREERIGNINIYRVGQEKGSKGYYGQAVAKTRYVIQAAQLASRLHKEKNYALNWGITATYSGMAALFFKWRAPKVPFLLTLQEDDLENRILRGVGIFYPLRRRIFKKANLVQAISKHSALFGHKRGVKAPIEIVPNGVDIPNFTRGYTAKELETLRHRMGITLQDKVIITTSRLVHKNAVAHLIKAIALLKNQLPTIKCLVLGTSMDEAKLYELVKHLRLEREVLILGYISHQDLPKYLKISDVFVRASHSEGSGRSLLEAMAAGLPVIGANVGGISDFLADGETGLYSKVEDENDLAEKILFLLDNEDLRRKLIRQGKNLAIREYSWDDIARRMDEIFKNTIKETPPKISGKKWGGLRRGRSG